VKLRVNPSLVIGFLLGVAAFSLFEAVGSFHAADCGQHHQQHGAAQSTQEAISEPFACSVFGFPTAVRLFMNHNEGFFVGGFTLLLVFVTAWLVWATIKLWQGAEVTSRKQLRAYVAVGEVKVRPEKPAIGLIAVFKNTGQTPAYKFRATVKTRSLERGYIPKEVDFPIAFEDADYSSGTVGSGNTVNARHSFDFREHDLPPGMTAETAFETIVKGDTIVYFWGIYAYVDAFGERQTGSFRRRIDRRKDGAWVAVATAKGNDET
jgi:hypothetical protein